MDNYLNILKIAFTSDKWRKWYEANRERFNSVANKHKKNRRKEFQKIILEKKSGPCVICEKAYSPYAMDFYHKDKESKLFRISDAARLIYSVKKLVEEISKCELYCANCRKIVETEEFLNNKSETKPRRRDMLRLVINEIKNQPCKDCGEVYPPYCMEFDHLGDKAGTISDMVSQERAIQKIKDEIDKSDLVCINCHRVRTEDRRDK